MLKTEKAFAAQHPQLNAKLFITSGGYEEETNPPMYKNFVQQLSKSKYKGFEMDNLVVDKTGHVSENPYAIARGLQFLFSKPEVTVDTALLKQYAGHYEKDNNFIYKNNALYLLQSGIQVKMSAETNKRFYIRGVNGIAEFKIDQKGKVTGFQFDGADDHIFFKKID